MVKIIVRWILSTQSSALFSYTFMNQTTAEAKDKLWTLRGKPARPAVALIPFQQNGA
jgi:hypothetical protein